MSMFGDGTAKEQIYEELFSVAGWEIGNGKLGLLLVLGWRSRS